MLRKVDPVPDVLPSLLLTVYYRYFFQCLLLLKMTKLLGYILNILWTHLVIFVWL